MIPLVAASERGAAQTGGAEWTAVLCVAGVGGPYRPACRTGRTVSNHTANRTILERTARAGESPVGERGVTVVRDPEYGPTRETGSEAGEPTLQG